MYIYVICMYILLHTWGEMKRNDVFHLLLQDWYLLTTDNV